LDSIAAVPKAPLDSTLVAYSFDETSLPYQNSAAAKRPAVSRAQYAADRSLATFAADSPTGKAGDYSLYFNGDSRIVYADDLGLLQFSDEDFTFEAWLKFNASDQLVERPVLMAYGLGGQSGYSFSFIRANMSANSANSTDSPSGKAGDHSVIPNGGLKVDDTVNPILNIEAGPITMEAWVKLDSLSGNTDIARYGDAYKFGFNNTGALLWTFLGIEDVAGSVVFTADQKWHHIAMAWDPGIGVTFYLDGKQVDHVDTGNTNRALQSNTLNIGTDSGGTSALLGSIDRLRIHNAVLTESQLDSDPANPKAPLANTVVAYNFDESGVPYKNATSAIRPAVDRLSDNTLAVTTFGILDAYSKAIISGDGKWHHIAAVHEQGVELRFYVDGKLGDTLPYTGGVRYASTPNFNLGSEASGVNPYVGYMDRLKITRGAVAESKLDYFKPAVSVTDWSLY